MRFVEKDERSLLHLLTLISGLFAFVLGVTYSRQFLLVTMNTNVQSDLCEEVDIAHS